MQTTLNPSENFTINRILRDHTDTSTYYVQAKIYDADSRTLLATKNLDDHGNRWFSTQYKIPYDDVFGNGKRIIIITSVYTDSGYTTRSDNHGDETEEYLIQQRWNPAVHYGAGAGFYDEEKLVKRLSEYFGGLLKPIIELEPVEFPEVDTDKLRDEIMVGVEACVAKYVSGIEMPPPTSIEPLLERLTALAQIIIERPKFEKTDTTALLKGIEETKTFLTAMRDDTTRVLEEIIVMLIRENQQLRSLSNGEGGKIRIEGNTMDQKKQNALSRIKMKHGV